MYSISTSGVEIELIFTLDSYEQQFLRYGRIFKIAIFGHETCMAIRQSARSRIARYILSFHSRGSKLSLFSLYGQQFPRYGPIFKIAIFGHET